MIALAYCVIMNQCNLAWLSHLGAPALAFGFCRMSVSPPAPTPEGADASAPEDTGGPQLAELRQLSVEERLLRQYELDSEQTSSKKSPPSPPPPPPRSTAGSQLGPTSTYTPALKISVAEWRARQNKTSAAGPNWAAPGVFDPRETRQPQTGPRLPTPPQHWQPPPQQTWPQQQQQRMACPPAWPQPGQYPSQQQQQPMLQQPRQYLPQQIVNYPQSAQGPGTGWAPSAAMAPAMWTGGPEAGIRPQSRHRRRRRSPSTDDDSDSDYEHRRRRRRRSRSGSHPRPGPSMAFLEEWKRGIETSVRNLADSVTKALSGVQPATQPAAEPHQPGLPLAPPPAPPTQVTLEGQYGDAPPNSHSGVPGGSPVHEPTSEEDSEGEEDEDEEVPIPIGSSRDSPASAGAEGTQTDLPGSVPADETPGLPPQVDPILADTTEREPGDPDTPPQSVFAVFRAELAQYLGLLGLKPASIPDHAAETREAGATLLDRQLAGMDPAPAPVQRVAWPHNDTINNIHKRWTAFFQKQPGVLPVTDIFTLPPPTEKVFAPLPTSRCQGRDAEKHKTLTAADDLWGLTPPQTTQVDGSYKPPEYFPLQRSQVIGQEAAHRANTHLAGVLDTGLAALATCLSNIKQRGLWPTPSPPDSASPETILGFDVVQHLLKTLSAATSQIMSNSIAGAMNLQMVRRDHALGTKSFQSMLQPSDQLLLRAAPCDSKDLFGTVGDNIVEVRERRSKAHGHRLQTTVFRMENVRSLPAQPAAPASQPAGQPKKRKHKKSKSQAAGQMQSRPVAQPSAPQQPFRGQPGQRSGGSGGTGKKGGRKGGPKKGAPGSSQ